MGGLMKASVWVAPERVEFREVERPVVCSGEALVKVAYAGICGTDLSMYVGRHPRAKPPLIMCHEFVGTIVRADGDAFPAGTPIVINPLLSCGVCYPCTNGIPHLCQRLGLLGIDRDGGFAEYALVPLHTVRPLPPSLPLAKAALIEPLAVACHAVRASNLRVGDVTAVLGAGPIGIMTAQVARLAGARRVFVSEIAPKRLSIAIELGFDVVDAGEQSIVQVVKDATHGIGVPVGFETAGVQATITDVRQIVRIGGQILQVGMPKTPPTLDLVALTYAEITIRPIRVYREEDFSAAIAIAAAGKVDLSTPVTHILPLEELDDAIQLALKASDVGKILLQPNA